jgi:manganese/iron transport system substrate-binding protein
MKKIIVTIMMVGMLTLAACGPQPAPANGTQAGSPDIKVLAANSFLADIAQNVAGERLSVESLIPIGLDPHAFEPTPQDVAKIADSQALIINGAGFEEWLEKTIENAGGNAKIIEAAAGMDMREPGEDEPGHGHDDDHSVESHAHMVCEQLEGEEPEESIQAGADAENAAEIGHHEEDEDEHEHEREIFTVILVAQGDDTFGGYLEFDADDEESYAFTTSEAGKISVTAQDNAKLEISQELPLDCGGMVQGLIFKLPPGEYLLSLSGFSSESVLFSAGSVHEHADEHADQHHEGDPHFWLDPNMVIGYVENIRDGLSEVDPDGRETYAQNAANYIEQLLDLDAWIRAQVEQIPAERRVLVTDHDTMGYFADQYGFTVTGAIIPSFSTGASPSAQELAGLIDQINDTGAPAIFLDVASNPKLAEQIAGETGVTVVADLHTHSVTAPGSDAPTYIEMMRYNTLRIVEALK